LARATHQHSRYLEFIAGFVSGDTRAEGDKLIASIWKDLKEFNGFDKGNIASIRLIPRKGTNEVYGEFKTVNPVVAEAQNAVSGDGLHGEVYIRLFFDEKNHTVAAVTLGNHMIVGVRFWSLRIHQREWEDPKDPMPGKKRPLSVTIETVAEEQRNNVITDKAFAVVGKRDMEKVWSVYMDNLVDAAAGRARTLGIRGTLLRSFNTRLQEFPDRTRNVLSDNLLPKEVQQP
jgi:hypothetical protein